MPGWEPVVSDNLLMKVELPQNARTPGRSAREKLRELRLFSLNVWRRRVFYLFVLFCNCHLIGLFIVFSKLFLKGINLV